VTQPERRSTAEPDGLVVFLKTLLGVKPRPWQVALMRHMLKEQREKDRKEGAA